MFVKIRPGSGGCRMDFDASLSFLRVEIDRRIQGRFPVPQGFLDTHVKEVSALASILDEELASRLIRHLETIYGTQQGRVTFSRPISRSGTPGGREKSTSTTGAGCRSTGWIIRSCLFRSSSPSTRLPTRFWDIWVTLLRATLGGAEVWSWGMCSRERPRTIPR